MLLAENQILYSNTVNKFGRLCKRGNLSQGSVLGPVMFLVYITDMPEGTHSVIKLFTDNAKVIQAITNHESCGELQEDINKLYKWNLSIYNLCYALSWSFPQGDNHGRRGSTSSYRYCLLLVHALPLQQYLFHSCMPLPYPSIFLPLLFKLSVQLIFTFSLFILSIRQNISQTLLFSA